MPRSPSSLKPPLIEICDNGSDAFAKRLPATLKEFAKLADVKRSYDFKTLPDDAFERHATTVPLSPGRVNRLLFSHLLRTVEAYQVVTLWRTEDLVNGCISDLNSELVITAAICARSLVEISVRYLLGANYVQHYLAQLPWAELDSALLAPERQLAGGQTEPLEHYFERLFWGSRMEDRVQKFPQITEQNILSLIDKYEKTLTKKGAGWSLRRDYYELLCELAHPNYVGNLRYAENVFSEGEWQVYKLSAEARSLDYEYLVRKVCGAMSASLEAVINGFAIFQQAKSDTVSRIGQIYP